MRQKNFSAGLWGFVFGVLSASFYETDIFSAFFFGLVSSASLAFFLLIFKSKWGILAAVFVLLFSAGMLRFNEKSLRFENAEETLAGRVGLKTELRGIISTEPDRREETEKLTLKTEGVKVLLNLREHEGEYRYGDEIEVSGIPERPEDFLTDAGKVFYYRDYLRKDGILYLMDKPEVKLISRGNGNWLKSKLFELKGRFLAKLGKMIPGNEGKLSAGLLLGARNSLTEEMKEDFIRTGIIHVVVFSGYQLSVVGDNLMKVLTFFFSVGASIWVAGTAIVLFTILVGAPSTAVRAAIMALLALWARALGREKDAVRIILLTIALMVLWNPFILRYDLSFQLSVLATVGVICVAPRFE